MCYIFIRSVEQDLRQGLSLPSLYMPAGQGSAGKLIVSVQIVTAEPPAYQDLYCADAQAGKKGGHGQAQAREKRLGVRDGELNVVGVEAALAVVADTLPRIIPSVLINRREGAHGSRSLCACLILHPCSGLVLWS